MPGVAPRVGACNHSRIADEPGHGSQSMLEQLTSPLISDTPIAPGDVLVRLAAALILGSLVAWIYTRTRRVPEAMPSFPTTLVLLAILIAMVTQVIGDNIARAFSLVGALSIVRFRTVVRDTEDTAYVIFAVAVGMAVGAHDLWVAVIGIVVIGLTAFWRSRRSASTSSSQGSYLLCVRMALGDDLQKQLVPVLDAHALRRELVSVETARQGVALDVTYEAVLRPGITPDAFVLALNRLEGVQDVELTRRGFEPV
jgi:hypothetical protein